MGTYMGETPVPLSGSPASSWSHCCSILPSHFCPQAAVDSCEDRQGKQVGRAKVLWMEAGCVLSWLVLLAKCLGWCCCSATPLRGLIWGKPLCLFQVVRPHPGAAAVPFCPHTSAPGPPMMAAKTGRAGSWQKSSGGRLSASSGLGWCCTVVSVMLCKIASPY